ncbi:MAG TPA: H(+)/Cl(-) exchange transporter ClcA [Thermoflexales bacterium]|mgnify:CR=1 FL=1|nr:H(+)/Cl(-) exchange transporter ClcA [Thermoflexales bacterium]HQW37005.1 H(+)/Cl(-) exchange transporter ClcA [Thermoflexales bacterium]HQZ22298.1 H(+)/Cl(-) exchange transporter ClcA [Thermoflexales bacterium]
MNAEENAESEILEYLHISQQRRWIFPRAALVGACAGIVALLFRALLAGGDAVRNAMLDWAHGFPAFGWIFPILFTMAGAALAVAITRRFAPEAAGSGIPHLEAVLHRLRQLNWKRVLPVKLIGGTLALGSGLMLGREGPTVQMGGAVGDAVSRLLNVSEQERLTLISAGAGAGLAAAFNAPLSGLVFVLEEVRRDFQPIVFGAAFVAAVIADIIARVGSGQMPVFAIPGYETPPLTALPVFALLGIAAGGLGVLFNRGLMVSIKTYAKLAPRYAVLAAAITGGIVGLVGWFSPTLIGGGHALSEIVLKGEMALAAIPLFFAVRFALTLMSYGTGAPGGIFAPLLVLGALLGLAIGQLAHMVFPSAAPVPAVFAVVGMAAYFTAIVRAPLTGIMLIIEMTGNYSLMLPLLVSCFCAYIAAEALKDLPIYEALLERDLARHGQAHEIKEPTVMEFVIQPGAPFVGMQVRSLGLPAGCILVRCSDGKREWVPTATTRMTAHMRITAIISPQAAQALEILRDGSGG